MNTAQNRPVAHLDVMYVFWVPVGSVPLFPPSGHSYLKLIYDRHFLEAEILETLLHEIYLAVKLTQMLLEG